MAHINHQIVHVRENSEEAMQSLFAVLDKNEPSAAMRDMRTRNLPPSFFIPPQRPHPTHSRDNSQDSCHFPTSHSLQPNHSRSHSSPAQFLGTQTLSVPTHHKQQKSVDLIDDPGWGAEQRHMLNFGQHFSQAQPQQQAHQQVPTQAPQQQPAPPPPQQQWNLSPSPNKVAPSAAHLNASPQPGSAQMSPQQQAMAAQSMSPGPMTQQVNLAAMLQPLPLGWEISITPDDEIYFINHLDKSTSWFHPQIPKQQPGQGPIRLSQLPPSHQQLVHQRIQQSQQSLHQQQLQLAPGNNMMAANQSGPRGMLAQPQPQPSEAQRTNEILHQLQKLQMEKHKLQQQQEELNRKEQLLVQRNFGQGTALPATHNAPALQSPAPLGIIDENNPSSQNQRTNSQEHVLKDMMMPDGTPMHPMQVNSSGVDPFLGQGQSADSHARQNSTDSGLGGMGNSYSLPRTPEDLLSNVDEMDSSNDGAKSKAHSSDFNMNDMGGMGMDISAPVDSMDGQMPTMEGADDLIPSLQPEGLPTDLLDNIDGKNIDSMLTWL